MSSMWVQKMCDAVRVVRRSTCMRAIMKTEVTMGLK